MEWSQATATRDACNGGGGAVDITTYEVNVLQHVQNGNTISTVSFNEMEYPRDVDISQLETSVTGLGKSTNHIKNFPHPLAHTQMKVSIRGIWWTLSCNMSVFIHDRVHGAAPGLKIKRSLELDSVINRSHTPNPHQHFFSNPCGCMLNGRIRGALLVFICMDRI